MHNGDIIRLGEDCEVNGGTRKINLEIKFNLVLHQSIIMRIILPITMDMAPTMSKTVSRLNRSSFSLNENHAIETQSIDSRENDSYM